MAKKRGQNEGSIYKHKSGLWAAQVSLDGKRVSKYFKTQREAREWVNETNRQIDGGLTLTGAQLGFDTYMREWIDAHKLRVRSKTEAHYRQVIEDHILPTLGKYKLKDLRPEHIQHLYNAKLKDGISERTVLMIHAVIHRALEQAVKFGLIGRNAADAVIRPTYTRKEMQTLDENQARSFLSMLEGTRNDALFWMEMTTGLRQGELLGLKWSDIDWRNRTIHIKRQLQRLKEGIKFTAPKTDTGKRAIKLGPIVIEKLRKHMEIQDLEKSLAGSRWQENDLIFPSTIGTPYEPRNQFNVYKRLLKQAGLPNIRFHDLRHTAATLMLKQGVHPKVVQERLGHSDITLTLNTYSHVLPSMQEEAADLIDEILAPIKLELNLNKSESPRTNDEPPESKSLPDGLQ